MVILDIASCVKSTPFFIPPPSLLYPVLLIIDIKSYDKIQQHANNENV